MSQLATTTGRSVRAVRKRLENDRRDALRAAADLADSTDAGDAAAFELACSRAAQLERSLETLPKIAVVREPDIYEQGDPYGPSFYGDLIAAQVGVPVPGVRDPAEAQERLRRHSDLVESRGDRGAARIASMRGIVVVGAQERAIADLPGQGEAFVPPAWLEQYWGSVVRAACPLRRLATNLDLPDYGTELIIPRFTSVSEIKPMPHENENVPDPYAATDSIKSTVRMFADALNVSQQLYERGGKFSDETVTKDMGEAYAQELQEQLMLGTGENGELLGLLNVAGANLVTYTAASPTVPELIEHVGQAAAKVSNKRRRPPSCVICRGNRWFQIASTGDKNGEPTLRPGTGSTPSESDTGPFGPLLNLPVYLDDTLPENQGTEANQDVIAVLRARDLLLLEAPAPKFRALAEGGAAGQMTVLLDWHTYAASFPQRYPTAIASVTGTGLVIPAAYR